MSAQPSQFDSHRFIKRLTNAGVSEEVAEILAEEHTSLILPVDVATKSDVAEARTDIADAQVATEAKIAEAQAATEAKIADVRIIARADIDAAEERIRTSVREDILAAEARIRAELATAMAGFRDAVADFKTSTLKWMFGMMMAYTGIVITTVVTLVVGLK